MSGYFKRDDVYASRPKMLDLKVADEYFEHNSGYNEAISDWVNSIAQIPVVQAADVVRNLEQEKAAGIKTTLKRYTEDADQINVRAESFDGLFCEYPLVKNGTASISFCIEHHTHTSLGNYKVVRHGKTGFFNHLDEAVEFYNSANKKRRRANREQQ